MSHDDIYQQAKQASEVDASGELVYRIEDLDVIGRRIYPNSFENEIVAEVAATGWFRDSHPDADLQKISIDITDDVATVVINFE